MHAKATSCFIFTPLNFFENSQVMSLKNFPLRNASVAHHANFCVKMPLIIKFKTSVVILLASKKSKSEIIHMRPFIPGVSIVAATEGQSE